MGAHDLAIAGVAGPHVLEAALGGKIAQVDARVGPNLGDAQDGHRCERLAQRIAAYVERLGEGSLSPALHADAFR